VTVPTTTILATQRCLRTIAAVAIAQVCLTASSGLAQHAESTAIDEYHQRIQVAAESDQTERQSLIAIDPIPAGFTPWWQNAMANRIQQGTQGTPLNLENLIVRTLQSSAQVRVFSDLPFIRQTAIVEAQAAFDWNAFVNTRWDDLSEPVGNILTTGGSPRFRTNQWSYSGGLRRRNLNGGNFEVAQDFGFQNNNSTFFQPNNQGTSRLRLSYTQPLLRGRGRVYNESLIVLANIDAKVADHEFSRQLQSHLLEVTRAYWSLYLERVTLVQKQQLFLRAEKIYNDLYARRDVDVVGSQLVRVEAAVTSRKSDLVRAEMAVRNAQERIHALVNDPELATTVNLEIIPMDLPTRQSENLEVGEILSTALQMRPEIGQSLKQIRGAAVRLGMSRHEILPRLDMILETFTAGLRGNSNIGGAFVDQFSTGEPGYSIGFQYEIPLGNRAARARLTRRQLELRQLQNQFRTTVETLLMETKVAAREVRTADREVKAKYHAMQAAAKRLDSIEQRWEALPGVETSIGLYLDDVLQAQQQLADTEYEFAKSETTYNLALMNLKRATGTLLQHEQIQEGVINGNALPTRVLEKLIDNQSSPNPQIGDEYFQAPAQITTPVLGNSNSSSSSSSNGKPNSPTEYQPARPSPTTVPARVADSQAWQNRIPDSRR
jgi:outer membrane protein TolC